MKIHVRHRRAKLRQHGYIKYRTQTIKIQRKLILNSTYGKLDFLRVRSWQSYTPELREQVAKLAKTTALSMAEIIAVLKLLPPVGKPVTLEELEHSRAMWGITQTTKKDLNEPQ